MSDGMPDPDPARLADLHAEAFTGAARWSARSFAEALAKPECFCAQQGDPVSGFVLGRMAVDEVELLTLVVAPDARRRGAGRALLARFEDTACDRGAVAAFLEVAADNVAGRALYDGAGWRVVGRRTGYYEGVDAVLMRKGLDGL